jgi:hypothetical protein
MDEIENERPDARLRIDECNECFLRGNGKDVT